MQGKRDKLSNIANFFGMLAILEQLLRRPQLIVINYHRIGDPATTEFDPWVFSATQSAFSDQIEFLTRRYDVVTPDEARDIIYGNIKLKTTAILITFDDGYLDNLTLAVPILKKFNAKAIFFLVTQYLDEPEIVPWWDLIAWLTRQCIGRTITIDHIASLTAEVTYETVNSVIAELLAQARKPNVDIQLIIQALETCSGVKSTDAHSKQRLLMNWNEAAQLREEGMSLGLHSHTHSILGKLDCSKQSWEINHCRRRLADHLGLHAAFFSYPVGTSAAFSHMTKSLVRDAGFCAAFSFYGGENRPGAIDPYDVRRVAFPANASLARSRAAVASMAITGRYWL